MLSIFETPAARAGEDACLILDQALIVDGSGIDKHGAPWRLAACVTLGKRLAPARCKVGPPPRSAPPSAGTRALLGPRPAFLQKATITALLLRLIRDGRVGVRLGRVVGLVVVPGVVVLAVAPGVVPDVVPGKAAASRNLTTLALI